MQSSAKVLFELMDQGIESAAKEIRNRVLSLCRDMPFTPDQRRILLPVIERELDSLIYDILGLLDNVGAVLPEGVTGWTILDNADQRDIRSRHGDGGADDYVQMWLDHLRSKGRFDRLMEAR